MIKPLRLLRLQRNGTEPARLDVCPSDDGGVFLSIYSLIESKGADFALSRDEAEALMQALGAHLEIRVFEY